MTYHNNAEHPIKDGEKCAKIGIVGKDARVRKKNDTEWGRGVGESTNVMVLA